MFANSDQSLAFKNKSNFSININ